ncbi:MAG: hypothetical protein N4A45_10530 [Flavobacteriales bacterium]|jgi:hypothetical protein|nr:hypothetical protein [Flavobacteriales bacterium]
MDNRKFNLNCIKDLVNVKYGDFQGFIEVDQFPNELKKICADKGVDYSKYHFLGLIGHDESNYDHSNSSITCQALFISKNFGRNFDEIEKTIKLNDGITAVNTVTVEVSYSVLFKYIKRISFGLISPLSKSITKLDISKMPTNDLNTEL